MQIEYAILASVISLLIAVFGFMRTMKKDSSDDASQMTTVLVKLENIQQGINDLKTDVSSIKNDIKEIDSLINNIRTELDSIHLVPYCSPFIVMPVSTYHKQREGHHGVSPE